MPSTVAFIQKSPYEKISVHYLAAALREAGHECRVFIELLEDDFLEAVAAFKPDICAVSLFLGEERELFDALGRLKARLPSMKTVAGGPFAAIFPDVINRSEIDYLLRGDSECTLPKLLRRLEKNIELDDVPGLSFVREDGTLHADTRMPLSDVSSVPIPDRDLYYRYPALRERPTKIFIGSRGCPYHCTYCYNTELSKFFEKPYWRVRPVEQVIAEIRYVTKKYGCSWVHFQDGTFNASVTWLREFLDAYSNAGLPNFLLSKATGRYLMYASDDIVFDPGSLTKAVATMDTAGEHCCGVAMAYRNVTAENEWKDFGVDLTLGRQILVNYGLLHRKQAIEVGGFSHAYQFYCADGDLCLKLLQRGRVILPEFNARVVHNDVQDKLKATNVRAANADIALYNATWEPVFGPLDRRCRRIWNAEAPEARLSRAQVIQAKQQRQLAVVKAVLPDGAAIKLHLGCGEQYFDGYVNIDFPPDMHTAQKQAVADIFLDVTTLDFPDSTIEEVRLHHLFEHFDRPKTLALLVRWSRWLAPGGRLVIETPDVLGSFRQILEDDLTFPQKQAVMRHIFGSHEASWAIHCDGWYAEKFAHVLGVFGFQVSARDSAWDRPPWLHNTTVVAVNVKKLSEAELMRAVEQVHAWHMVDTSPCEMRKLQHWTLETAKAAGIKTTS